MQSRDLINPDEYQYAVPPPLWKAMGSSVTHVLFYLLTFLWCQTGWLWQCACSDPHRHPFFVFSSPAAHAQITFLEEPVNTTVLQDGRVSLRCVAVDAGMRRAHVSWRKGVDEPLSNRLAIRYWCTTTLWFVRCVLCVHPYRALLYLPFWRT